MSEIRSFWIFISWSLRLILGFMFPFILIDLFPLIIYPNKISSLILDDNRLKDVPLLDKMPLYNLKQLLLLELLT